MTGIAQSPLGAVEKLVGRELSTNPQTVVSTFADSTDPLWATLSILCLMCSERFFLLGVVGSFLNFVRIVGWPGAQVTTYSESGGTTGLRECGLIGYSSSASV